ncbi:unnamed protein product, partial [Cyprideis torosa]
MKLLTHNFLSSKCIRGVKLGYPLKIEASKVDVRELEFNEDALQNILPKVIVQEGYLECPETGRKFPIKNGIPNMLVNEDEV